MSKIVITLVGGQPVPSYNIINTYQPDKVLMIYSNTSRKEMKKIKDEFKDKEIQFIKSEPLDPVNLDEIENRAKEYYEKYKDEELIVDISSGTKPWSFYFSQIFGQNENIKIVYIDQNNNIWNLKDKTKDEASFDMAAQFRLKNNPLEIYTKFSKYTEEDAKALEEIEKARKLNIGVFTELTNIKQSQKTKSGILHSSNNAYLEWNCSNCIKYHIERKETEYDFEIQSPNVFSLIFNAGWFEYKIAKILSNWDEAKEIFMNCKFAVVNSNANSHIAGKYPKNEVDIIVNTGKKLLFVECKTNIANSTDIEKFNSVVKNYGGTGSKGLFVCLNKFKQAEIEKIQDYNMGSYSLEENQDNPEGNLIDFLNRYMISINK